MKSLRDYVYSNNFFVVAHRGSSGTAPENTMAAFQEAIDAGAMMIETDVQFTTDGKIIAFHDFALDRTAQGPDKEEDFSYESVRNLDVGSWFDEKFADQRIPELKDILELLNDKAYLDLEIKSRTGKESDDDLKKIIRTIYDYSYEDKMMFCSFNYRLLQRIKELDKRMRIGAIKLPDDYSLPSELAKEIQIDAYICSLEEVKHRLCEDAIKNDIFMAVYSIDSSEDLKKIMGYHVQAIATNYPAKIMQELAAMKS
jgi:glycerophosphoryl diester phosphodiesterase